MIEVLDVAVIIPSYRDRGHLQALLVALGQQNPPLREVVVSHSSHPTPELLSEPPMSPGLPLVFLHSDQRLFSGVARNRGARRSTASWLAFLDDDVVPARGWAGELASMLNPGNANRCFVGSLGCSSSGGYWGMSLWFVEFGSVHPYLPSRSVEAGASANMLVHRELFDRVGGFPEAIERSVDVTFMRECSLRGAEVWVEPGLRADHHNPRGAAKCLGQAYRIGRSSARVRQRLPLRGGLAVRFPFLAPLLLPVRMLQLTYRVLRWGRGFRWTFVWHLAGIALILLSWTWGFTRQAFAGISATSMTVDS